MKREEFKFLKKAIYLDHAAGSLKPKSVIKAGVEFYENYSINPHSIDSEKGVWLVNKIKDAREATAKFSNAKPEDVVFTSGTTDSLNRIARMLELEISEGDEILLNTLNHASNVIPWIELSKRTGAKLTWANKMIEGITPKTKIMAFAEMNNTVEDAKDMESIYKVAKEKGIYVINDAAQSITHKKVNFEHADFTVYSSNKLYGPTGIGIMLISKELQDKLPNVVFGGGSNATFSKDDWIPHSGIHGRESGTPNTAGILMHLAAIEFMNEIGWEEIQKHEQEVAEYAYEQLSKVEGIAFASEKGDKNIIFNIRNINSQDIVSFLGHRDIILRAGQHCVRLIQERTGSPSWIRASIGLYSEKEDFDKLIEQINKGGDFLDFI
ncbi:aminotransferase class V-fold PLP-dependent enzyme [Mycoplasma marinum]|uniref:Nitrogen fixation protein NifS n=1 Tax=Mycoplasma marinum TaxID=1937190 RepID=A0A4R0XT01_9MOLU|nr:aminotransferase class V-fold PLP-dependent enzyme [Mycoplasma marinum]TCG10739.1 nitrogen fixation protein NifS [Mycoplasma marinum]